VREDDAEPELLDDADMELRDGEIVAMAVKTAFDAMHAEEEQTLIGHTHNVTCVLMHGDNLISGSRDQTIKVWSTHTWACERTLEGHDGTVSSMVVHGDKLISDQRHWRRDDQSMEYTHLDMRAHPRRSRWYCVLLGGAWRQVDQRFH
jgi:hypothetical protein